MLPKECILNINNIAGAAEGTSCSLMLFKERRREAALLALAHSHLQDLT